MLNDQLRLMRLAAAVFAVSVVLSGCARLSIYDLTDQLGFMHSYKAAKSDFDRGRIMEAREEVLSMDRSRSDYKQARTLLRDKIEPARLRLLRHYANTAAVAEKNGDWSSAMNLYEQAAGFSTSPAALVRKQKAMSLKMRQVRLDALLRQRRREDAVILSWQNDYEPPKGVAADDVAFRRAQDYYTGMLDDRISNTFSEAKRYMRKGMPDLAYVEIESYLRYEPDSHQGKQLMAEIRKQLPRALHIPSEKAGKRPSKLPPGPMVLQPEGNSVGVEEIRKQMVQKHWLEAKRLALVYRREGGAGAAALLGRIQSQIKTEAAAVFQRGRVAFSREDIDSAVKYWSRAVELMPNDPEYVDALQRGKQLQDRLRILREAASENAPKAGKAAGGGK